MSPVARVRGARLGHAHLPRRTMLGASDSMRLQVHALLEHGRGPGAGPVHSPCSVLLNRREMDWSQTLPLSTALLYPLSCTCDDKLSTPDGIWREDVLTILVLLRT